MTISGIDAAVRKNISGRRLVFCDASLGLDGSIIRSFLQDAFEKPSLDLTDIIHTFEPEKITLAGSVEADKQNAAFTLELYPQNDNIWLEFDLVLPEPREVEFFEGRSYTASGVRRKYGFVLEAPPRVDSTVSGDVAGEFAFGDLLRLMLPGFDFPFADVELGGIRLTHGLQYRFGEAKTLMGAQTSAQISLTDKFKAGNFGVQVAKTGDRYDFALFGSLLINGAETPLILRYTGDSYFLGVDTGTDGIALPSLNSIAGLAGVDLESVLPEGFPALNSGLKLNSLMA